MSIWIFDRTPIKITLGLVLIAGLTACGSSRTDTGRSYSTPQKTTIDVAGRNVVIEGPQGFCVDRETSQLGGDTAFVLLGNCAVVSPKTRAPEPKVRALLTASISNSRPDVPTVADSVNEMDRFFRSETGRTALSRDSEASTVEVLETFQRDDTFYLRASDTSEGIVPGAANDYWRSYFDLNGQIVSVSVIGFMSEPLSPATGLSTVQEFTDLIRSRNGATEFAAATEPVDEPETTARTERPAKDTARTFWTLGLLRRILQ